jgi:hypothetical protein
VERDKSYFSFLFFSSQGISVTKYLIQEIVNCVLYLTSYTKINEMGHRSKSKKQKSNKQNGKYPWKSELQKQFWLDTQSTKDKG